jgi:hypothetical protein
MRDYIKMQKISLRNILKELYSEQKDPVASEPEATEGSGVVSEIQTMVDGNKFLAGQRVNEEDLITGGDYILFASQEAANHIKERHSDPSKPGSTFEASLDLRSVMEDLLSTPPSEDTGAMVKWIAVDQGSPIGGMGVAHASPEEVAAMEDYQMPDGRREMVKLKRGGERQPTSEISLITAKLGTLSNGKTALSLVTMFPGGMSVDGISIPPSRADFAKAGLYFVIPGEETPAEEAAVMQEELYYKRFQKLAGIIKD